MRERIKELRDKTGAGILVCRDALIESGGDVPKAIQILRKKGEIDSKSRQGKATTAGAVISYIHPGNQVGVMLELSCETDFVARSEKFLKAAKSLAMHIAAAAPLYLSREDVPRSVLNSEQLIYTSQALGEGKPKELLSKIVEGKTEKFFRQNCLLEQVDLLEPENNECVNDVIKRMISAFKENIVVKRFARFRIGE